MGKYLQQLLEQDNPVGGGQPAGEPDLCFDPNTGAQIPCPPAGDTQAGAGGGDPALGGAPQNQDTTLVPNAESKQVKEEDEVDPDDSGACPEGYEKSDTGKCKKVGGSEGGNGNGGDKKDESRQTEDDTPPWLKDKNGDGDDKDDKNGDDNGDDDDEDDDDDEGDKEESLGYRTAIAAMVQEVMKGGKAREIVRKAFEK